MICGGPSITTTTTTTRPRRRVHHHDASPSQQGLVVHNGAPQVNGGRRVSPRRQENLLANSSPAMVTLIRTFFGRLPPVLLYQADSCEKWR